MLKSLCIVINNGHMTKSLTNEALAFCEHAHIGIDIEGKMRMLGTGTNRYNDNNNNKTNIYTG